MALFKKWVPKWFIHISNFFLLMVFTNALFMNIIGYDMSLIQGHFGATAEEFQLSIQLPIAIMLIFVPLSMALAFGLPLRSIYFVSGLATTLFYLGCLFAPTIYWFTFFKTLVCLFGLTALLCTIIPIMLTYNPTFNMPLLFAILYSVVFGLADIFKYSGTYIISKFNWEYGFLFFISLLIIAVVIIFVCFKKERVLPKPKGGGSFDLPGFTILLSLFVAIVILLVKGPNEHWLESNLIQGIFALCITLIGLYIFYSKDNKSAYVQLEIFTYRNTLIGGFLLLASGFLLSTGGALNQLMGISRFNNISTGKAYLPEILGVISASILCVVAIKNKIYFSTISAVGFICLALFHLTMFLQFYQGIGTHDFFWPLVMRGAGQVFLYLSLGIYVAENIPKHLSGSRVIVSVFFKIIFGAFIGGAAFGYFATNNNKLHQTGISQGVNIYNQLAQTQYNSAKYFAISKGANENESNSFATKDMMSKINNPASLLANKDLYLVCGLISLLLALIVALFKLMQHPPGKILVEPVPYEFLYMLKEKILSYINPNSLLLLCLMLMVFFVPMIEAMYNAEVYQILFSTIFLLSALALRNHSRKTLITLAVCLIIFDWSAFIINLPILSLITRILQGLAFLYVVIQLISQTAAAKEVNLIIIADSISGYLLVGIIYGIVAYSIANSRPDAFNFPAGSNFDQLTGMSRMFYFTFVTYSSTGYGDITPAIPAARSFSTLISVTGQMYVAIIIALLVGKFSSKSLN